MITEPIGPSCARATLAHMLTPGPMTRIEDRFRFIDACLWFLVPALVLTTITIGFVSGDGLAKTVAYRSGTWFLNPNHLIFEPLGAWWQHFLTRLGVARPDPDKLKLLSVLSGAAAVALLRVGVTGPLAPSRFAANHATAWAALSSAFTRLWISDETHMIQMPFLALAAIVTLRYMTVPSLTTSIAIGTFIGVSALCFISNILLAPALILVIGSWFIARRDWPNALRLALGIVGAIALICGTAFLSVWYGTAASTTTFLRWMTTYAGGHAPPHVISAYGTTLSLRGVFVAMARTVYGSASALVDLAPFVQLFRDNELIRLSPILGLLALLTALTVLARLLFRVIVTRHERSSAVVLLLLLAWLLAVLPFALYWNNSDDQFYFQLAIPLAVLVTTSRLKKRPASLAVAVLSGLVLLWNTADLVDRYIRYPRAERVAVLQSIVADAGLVIFPGQDEVGQLLFFVTGWDRERGVSLMSLATKYNPEDGLSILERRVRETLGSGQHVTVVSIYDTPPQASPWKDLRSLGYEHSLIEGFFQKFPVERTTKWVGPFSVRSISPNVRHRPSSFSSTANGF